MYPEAERIVAIGDLEGNFEGLVTLLRASRLVNRKNRWTGRKARLVQLGDIFGRGDQPRECCDLLMTLAREARKAGGGVHVLVGNHEAEVVHRFEFECDANEYHDFATPAALRRWNRERAVVADQMWHLPAEESMPMANLLAAWEMVHPPGRTEFRKALSPRGKYGKWLCSLPAAVQLGRIVFSHAGILPDWAHDGIDGLNELVRRDMSNGEYFPEFPEFSPLIDPEGPLWTRSYVHGAKWVSAALRQVLGFFGASAMVIGHTPDRQGKIRTRYSGRIICIDTGIGRTAPSPNRKYVGKLAALVVEGGALWAVYPPRARVRIGRIPGQVKPARRPGGPGAA